MAHRTFADEEGTAWQVWEVQPSWAERRSGERRDDAPRVVRSERRRGDRRAIVEMRPSLSPELSHGWLTFESAVERRRLAPVPPGWDALPESELLRLMRGATPVSSARKRLIE